MKYSFDLRVYYEDTDAGGIVYYANYLKFAERARTEILRKLGIGQAELMKKHGIGFVVRHASIDFIRPAMLDDRLKIESEVQDITKASLTMRQVIKKGAEKLVELDVRIAVVASNTGRIARMPEPVFKLLKK